MGAVDRGADGAGLYGGAAVGDGSVEASNDGKTAAEIDGGGKSDNGSSDDVKRVERQDEGGGTEDGERKIDEGDDRKRE